MMKKIITICLSIIFIFSSSVYSFAEIDLNNPPAEPTKPSVENYHDDTDIKNRTIKRMIGAIIVIVTGFIFLITEDMSLPMTLVDRWTFLMIVLLILQIIITILCKHKKTEKTPN